MEQTKLSLSLQCPDHGLAIGMLSTDLKAKKIGYCYECIAENGGDAAFLQTLKTVSSYLKENSSFYEKCRQRGSHAGQPPADFLAELSKRGERLEKFSRHIDEEKDKVKKCFEEIRKNVLLTIDEKEKECLELLDKEMLGLSEAYTKFEKLLMIGWPRPSDTQNLYPDSETLRGRISKIGTIDQLRAFMVEIQQETPVKDLSYGKEDSLKKIKNEVDRLISCLNMIESYLPKVQTGNLNFETLTRGFIKEVLQQEVQVENSVVSMINEFSCASKIISDSQFEILEDWLPKSYEFYPKLLFRGSLDGMSSLVFHQKCDGKGATITLIKCRFEKAQESSILGGFLDESMHSDLCWTSSKEAFLFLLKEQKNNSIKCPILESKYAFYGYSQYGPTFGNGDLNVDFLFKTGFVNPSAYSNSIALCSQHGSKFYVEEVEIFQVQ